MTAQTEVPETKTAELGKARLRKEDERLITGQTNWTDNITLPGMLHIAFLRSPYAHARITSVDVSAARNEPGVIAAYSGADFAAEQGSLPCAWPVTPDIVIPAHPPMAVDEVRYVGEAVACVVARDRYAAADALAAIEVDYEQLPPVLDMRAALEDASPKVHEAGNKSFDFAFRPRRHGGRLPRRADRDRAHLPSAAADPGAMEPRAVVCSCVGGEFTLWSATQIPHVLRFLLAAGHRHPGAEHPGHRAGRRRRLRIQAAGHGRRGAGRLDRPQAGPAGQVDRVPQRGQHDRASRPRPVAAAQARGGQRRQDPRVRRGPAGRHGRLPHAGHAGRPDLLGAFMFPAIYKMDAYSFKCIGVFTTKMPTDAYRGAGRPEATFAIERMMDELAAHLGMDPLERAGAELDQARGVPVHHHRRP